MYVRFGKRICDIIIGLVALPFVLLIIAVLAPIIKHEDGGPVFYNAPRVGKDGVDFKMYKLRSMRVNARTCHGDGEHLQRRRRPAHDEDRRVHAQDQP